MIGASRRPGTVGAAVFHNLLAGGFAGPVYPINPNATVVQSVLAYPTVEDVPGPVDLAVIAVPAACVLEVAEQCGRKGVSALVVLTAGFGETDDGGPRAGAGPPPTVPNDRDAADRPELHRRREHGPRCRPQRDVRPEMPPPGRVAFASQSGALGLAAIQEARRHGIGISEFVSMGNKADISGNDLLQYWESDPRTDVILLYLESFGNPRKFARIARRVGRTKPIVAIKSGRSAAGARATASHTGALVAASDVTVDALLSAGRRDPGRDDRRPLRRRRAAGHPAGAEGAARRHRDQCRRPGDPVRRRLRGRRAGHCAAGTGDDGAACASYCRPRRAWPTRSTCWPPGRPSSTARRSALVASDPNIDAVIAIFIQPLATQAADVADGRRRRRA